MDTDAKRAIAEEFVEGVARLVPRFLTDPIEATMSGGNAAVCVIDDDGRVYGRVFGDNKGRGRVSFATASRKVAQVWVTGYATGRFEELVFTGKIDDKQFGIIRPEFIGWQGGVPLRFDDGSPLAAAFSGFRGEKDVEIIEQAASTVAGLGVVDR